MSVTQLYAPDEFFEPANRNEFRLGQICGYGQKFCTGKRDRRNILTQKAPIIQRSQVILSDPDSHDVPRLEAEINNLVYNFYNPTPGEIKIIEG